MDESAEHKQKPILEPVPDDGEVHSRETPSGAVADLGYN